jgi:hypothetical protein
MHLRNETIRAFASCIAVAGILAVAVSGIAKDSPAFVRITPAGLTWQDVAGGRGVRLWEPAAAARGRCS